MTTAQRLAWTALTGALLALGACLEPLPEPTSCEEPARVIEGECVPCEAPKQFVNDTCTLCPPAPELPFERCVPRAFTDYGVPPKGCLAGDGKFERYNCVTDHDPARCECDAAALEQSAQPSCYSDGTCPAAVGALGANAQCFPFEPADVHWYGATSHEGCDCGCIENLARCDGRAFAFGGYSDASEPLPQFDYIRLDLGDRLPDSGTVGAYMLVRGFATPLYLLFTKGDVTLTTWGFYVTTDSVQQIGYGPDQDGFQIDLLDPYSWADASGRPDTLFLAPPPAVELDGIVTLVEIDCIVPFVIPI